MKKWILWCAALVMILTSLGAGVADAAVSPGKYKVPIVLWNAYEEKESMGNGAMVKAEVEVKAKEVTYTIHTKKMEFMQMTGGLTNLFIYENGKGTPKQEATKLSEGVYQFTRPGKPEDEIRVAVWVDAMDALAGGKPGAGEQDARLRFNWNEATLLKGAKPEPTPSATAPKGINITVNGKAVQSEVAPFIENERTMVPVRFISEALGLHVDWDNATRTVVIGEGTDLVKLTIGGKEIVKADGSTVAIDAPAMIKSERTFVPLRAIAEISGARVSWDDATRTAVIEK